ncbi:F0F1 ATP synthase subunit B family protein [Bacillus sp. EB01]|uniref:F0F1 ATP synthase subunit B family protein n=1 Tax=Bacillus sp. EB01 TaxID=1347086 RepID=UPI0005C625AB|nr:hypothetical protein [Bacillus sp. EB01]
MGDIELFGIQISLGTMIYQAIIFTILVFLIKKFVMKKLLNVMEDRQTYIEKQLLIAEKYKTEAEQKLAEQQQLVQHAKVEARLIRASSEKEAMELFERSKQEAVEIIKDARNDARKQAAAQNCQKGA